MTSSHGRRPAGAGESVAGEAAAAAFDAIYRAFFVRLVRHASWHFGLSKEDASEVVQDTFAVALVKLDTHEEPGPWLYKTVDYLAMNLRRKTGRRARLLAQWGYGEAEGEESDLEGGQP